MSRAMEAVCEKQAVCKCCGADALPYGLVDFHKNCEQRRRHVLEISGIPIYYHRCTFCGFLFTTAFDEFSNDDFRKYIYNDEYQLVDPDYGRERPMQVVRILSKLFSTVRPKRVLDYGAGTGLLAALLRMAGFPHVENYDPFVAWHAERPAGKFDFIVCVEVMEHSTDPAALIADLNEFLEEPGLVFFTTVLQPEELDQCGLGWWYVAPRNGHVSLYSKPSLFNLAARSGLQIGSFNETSHVLFKTVPEFAKHFAPMA